jgi:hypothetical protein
MNLPAMGGDRGAFESGRGGFMGAQRSRFDLSCKGEAPLLA